MGQITDMQPGVHPNGLFWTTEIPRGSFKQSGNGRKARLRLRDLPLVDTLVFAGPIGLASIADIDVTWRATSEPISRGSGTAVDPTDPAAFEGELAEATAQGWAKAKRVGFSFKANSLTSSAYFAEFGHERNGSFL